MAHRSVVVSRTPFRVTFAGGGTDLPEYFRTHGPGACVAGTIDRGIFVMVVENFVASEIRVSYRITEDALGSVDDIAHGTIREALRLLRIPSGIQVITATQMPSRGTGIGSSSSCVVGALNALHTWRGDRVGPHQLAREAVRIERDILHEPGGIQDQYAVAYGGLSLIQIERDGAVSVQSLNLDHDGLNALNERLLLFYTGVERSSGAIHSRQTAAISEHVDQYHRMRDLALETVRAIERLDYAELGRIMDANWALKRGLSEGISTTQIDGWYDLAKRHGAWGGKILGAGGGGFLFLVADPERHRDIERALAAVGLVKKPMSIAIDGSSIVLEE